jgi:adenosylhomocysteine nucleosidase
MAARGLQEFGGCRVLFQMAVDAEYGTCLRGMISPLMTGVGPVEAAIRTTQALSAGPLPQLVVSLGSAGSRRLEQGRVYQAESVSYRDMDASPLGFPRGTTPLIDLPAVVLLPHRLEGVPQASLSTGANVVSGSGYDAVEADMVDMETFAVMRACHVFGVPLIALRGISDGAKELGHLGDWTEYLHVVDENLAAALLLVKRALHEGLLR